MWLRVIQPLPVPRTKNSRVVAELCVLGVFDYANVKASACLANSTINLSRFYDF